LYKGEFQAAVEEGRSIGSRILLGDRDVDVTLESLATAISLTDSEQFLNVAEKLALLEEKNGLSFEEGEEINKEKLSSLVETLKQRELIVSLMNVLRGDLPLIYNALIGERDIFMAQSIDSSDAQVLVGVVGMAHMQGMEKSLQSKQYQVVRRNCPKN
jgi:pheromone shutdown protein TraB